MSAGRDELTRRDALRAGLGLGAAALPAAGCTRAGSEPTTARRDSICRICTMACGIEAWVRDGRVTRVAGAEQSPTRGFACINALALPELLDSPRRVRYPLVRRGGELRRASWEEALRVVADGIGAASERHGPSSVGILTGWAFVRRNIGGWLKRLADVVGTPNYASSSSICVAAGRMASRVTFGRVGYADFNRSDLCVVWGWNPMHATPVLANVLLRRKMRGAHLVVIDPARTPVAAAASTHLRIRPGTDLALALALLGTIVREGLHDDAFVAANAVGFEELAAAVEPVTAAWAAELTGLPESAIVELARRIARSPSAAGSNGLALEQSPNGFQTCRALDCLWAVTGNVGTAGGKQLLPFLGTEGNAAARALPPTPAPVSARAVGAAEHPLFVRMLGEAQGNLYPRAILEDDPYPMRALLVAGANPALSAADSDEIRRAFARLDLLVVAEVVMTETARMADVVLPVAHFLEADEYVGTRRTFVEAVAPPPGEARPDWEIAASIARALGHGEYFPWETGREAREAQRAHLRTMEGPPEEDYPTPSGKIELAAPQLAEVGVDVVPRPVEAPPPTERFPLVLSTGNRRPGLSNSQLRGIPMIEARVGPARLEIAAETAAELGLEDGGAAILETAHGRLEVDVAIAPIRPGVAKLPHCAYEANANELTSSRELDRATGFPNLRALPCRLRRRS